MFQRLFERLHEPLLPAWHFQWRLIYAGMVAAGIVAFGLGIGVLGYHVFEGLPWIDSLLNASMILGGMGPVDPLHTTSGKLFASFYALFSGIVFLTMAAVLVAPVLHRLLHLINLRDEEGEEVEQ